MRSQNRARRVIRESTERAAFFAFYGFVQFPFGGTYYARVPDVIYMTTRVLVNGNFYSFFKFKKH